MVEFWERAVLTVDDCWKWTGQKNAKGYGMFWHRYPDGTRLKLRANRASYMIHHGPIPKNLMVMHYCDNPECCNPSHLSLGTARNNRMDCILNNRDRSVRDSKGKWTSL